MIKNKLIIIISIYDNFNFNLYNTKKNDLFVYYIFKNEITKISNKYTNIKGYINNIINKYYNSYFNRISIYKNIL